VITVRPFEPDDEQAALDLRVAAFSSAMHVDITDVEVDDYVPADHRVVADDDDGRVVGHLAVWPFAQQFGGRGVPMGGVGGVAVAIDQRGRGIGSQLLAAGLDLMADRGLVLSTLYPSIPLPYRRWGWEVAGMHVRRRVALRDLLALPAPPDDVVLRPWTDDDLPAVVAVHNAVTATEAGGLVATERWLRRAFRPDPDDPEIVVVATRDGEVVGASLAGKVASTTPRMGFDLQVLRLFGRDHDVERALWHNLASHHSVAEWATIHSQPADGLLFSLPRGLPAPDPASTVWMSRLVDAPAAVAARGWPPLDATVPLAIEDPRRAANAGPHVLEVAGGHARLSPGGSGRVAVDIGALSSMYTGFATPRAMVRAGRLRGADEDDLASLSLLFAAPTPFLRDSF